jgi:hypothetical protein
MEGMIFRSLRSRGIVWHVRKLIGESTKDNNGRLASERSVSYGSYVLHV